VGDALVPPLRGWRVHFLSGKGIVIRAHREELREGNFPGKGEIGKTFPFWGGEYPFAEKKENHFVLKPKKKGALSCQG